MRWPAHVSKGMGMGGSPTTASVCRLSNLPHTRPCSMPHAWPARLQACAHILLAHARWCRRLGSSQGLPPRTQAVNALTFISHFRETDVEALQLFALRQHLSDGLGARKLDSIL